MFAIMGATGQVGGAVVEVLSGRGEAVRALTRDPDRATRLVGGMVEVVRADTTDPTSLTAAFSGAKPAFVMLVPPLHAADVLVASRTASTTIGAAVRAAHVPHVVALSSAGAHLAEGNSIVRTLHDFERELAGCSALPRFPACRRLHGELGGDVAHRARSRNIAFRQAAARGEE